MRMISDLWGRSYTRIVLLAIVAVLLLVVAEREPTLEAAPPIELVIVTTSTTSTTTSTTTTTTVVTADSRREPVPERQVTVAEVTTTTVPDGVRCPEMWPIISALWPADEWANADYVAYKESGCRPEVVRAGADWGLFQINRAAHHGWIKDDWGYTSEDLLNPEVNAFMAFLIWLRGVEYTDCGWSAWYMSVDPASLC